MNNKKELSACILISWMILLLLELSLELSIGNNSKKEKKTLNPLEITNPLDIFCLLNRKPSTASLKLHPNWELTNSCATSDSVAIKLLASFVHEQCAGNLPKRGES